MAQGASGVPECLPGSDYPVAAYSGHSGYAADPATCGCECGAPTDVTCSTPATSLFSEPGCGAAACHIDSRAHECADTVLCDEQSKKVVAASFGGSTLTGGKCQPLATTTVTPAGWRQTIHLCAPVATAADCKDGVCQPTPSPLFASKNRCVIQDGNIAECPPAFPVRQVFYSGGSDTRGCSTCECGALEGVTCRATVTTGNTAVCKEPFTVSAPSGCLAMPPGERIVVNAGTPQGKGSCTPSGGQPIGTFDPGVATTVCCLE